MCVLQQSGGSGGVAAGGGKLRLGQLARDVQALRDVKHFVKDYRGHLPPADPSPGNAHRAFSWLPARAALPDH